MTATRNKLIDKIALLLILISIFSGLYYLSVVNSKKINSGKVGTAKNQQKDLSNQEQRILDCAKKIAINSDLTSGGSTSTSYDCVFQGCGDFFQ